MPVIKAFMQRFAELYAQTQPIAASKHHKASEYFSGDYVDGEAFLKWKVQCKNLLQKSCGQDSEHYQAFLKCEVPVSFRTNAEEFVQLKSVFVAAKEDYEGGYVDSVRSLIQAEVFGSEIEQAQELLASSYISAAAVIAGVVLETTLRQMCDDRGLAKGKLDKMNSDLTKSGAYTVLVQKRLTALADIRNNAAHGNTNKFAKSDVEDMISYVERFLGDHV